MPRRPPPPTPDGSEVGSEVRRVPLPDGNEDPGDGSRVGSESREERLYPGLPWTEYSTPLLRSSSPSLQRRVTPSPPEWGARVRADTPK